MAPEARYDSEDVSIEPLRRPLTFHFSGKTAPNRFLKAGMSERLATWDPKDLSARGVPTDNLINLYKRWGEGGFGIVLTGNIMLEGDQLEAAGCTIITLDDQPKGPRFEAYKKLAEVTKAKGSLVIGQLSHPGRQVAENLSKNPVSASDVQLEGNILGMTFAKPHAATEEEIERIIQMFVHAAEYLAAAGYDGVEFHGAHGYLLAQFLAPSTNKRTDKYGGSLENRARLTLEIARRIRATCPKDFVIGLKLNSVEFQDHGFSPEEAKVLCAKLEEGELDFVELSGGTYEELAFGYKRESTLKREAFFIEFAEQIVPALSKTKSYVTGGLKSSGAMVQALQTVDGVGLARAICQEPRLPADILSGKVKAAIKQRIDPNNFALTYIVSGTQIGMIGKDQEPIDMSQEALEQAFMKEMGVWGASMAEDTEMKTAGYVNMDSIKPNAYGVSY